jgi:hypothetical protein
MAAPERACASCGKLHSIDELELTFFRPDPVVALSPDERAKRAKESDDLCTIDWKRYFVRGVIPLPVPERDSDYCLGVWAEVDERSFRHILETWSLEDQSGEPLLTANLANHIRGLPETLGLSILVELSGPRSRPRIRIADPEHPLHAEQTNGISEHRASEYTGMIRVGEV